MPEQGGSVGQVEQGADAAFVDNHESGVTKMKLFQFTKEGVEHIQKYIFEAAK